MRQILQVSNQYYLTSLCLVTDIIHESCFMQIAGVYKMWK